MSKLSLLLSVSAAVLLAGGTAASAADMMKPVAAPVATAPVVDGFVSIAGGGAQLTDGSDEPEDAISGLSLEGAASAEYNLTSVLGFQGDLLARRQNYGIPVEPATAHVDSIDGAGHFFYRDSKFLIGGIVQYGVDALNVDADGGNFSYGNIDHTYGGAEAQAYLGDATLYGQIAAQRMSGAFDDFGSDLTGWIGTAEARYFLTPDLKLDVTVGDQSLGNADGTLTVFSAGAGAEYRLPDMPFSLFAKYDYNSANYGGGEVIDSNRILFGAKFNFGTDTLEQRDRSGASLKPFEGYQIPTFGLGG